MNEQKKVKKKILFTAIVLFVIQAFAGIPPYTRSKHRLF